MQMRLSYLAVAMMTLPVKAVERDIDQPPVFAHITLAKNYSSDINLGHYWVSEKLDGIRAIWDGNKLTTRGGKEIIAPDWFVAPLPDFALEGELWAGRGEFTLVQTTVLDQKPSDSAWRKIRLVVFDLPNNSGSYAQRYTQIKAYVERTSHLHIDYLPQNPVVSEPELMQQLAQVTEQGGEGLMLRDMSSHYHSGRHDSLLKLKQYQDAEATVIGYKTGSGKYKNQVGSLLVKLPSGLEFYIGSGLSDALRQSPPPLGTQIQFRYNGLTDNNVPRFARYIRQREHNTD
ncbi:DNA ligase [Vibrio sp. JPW-9-11-11]|uniref:DNA ligase n=1 Tax=Vibrio sp. JPW-9-11-11 TaxID=1416532 RepID=UPI0015932321|nr:DNA ligase [Vibrio sp. JPW-9-11-11]NVD06705.1 DNA ligase [Vibrio sp. JPW-9-11-11]